MQQICPSCQDITLYWTHRKRLLSLLGMDVRCIIRESKHESLQQKENTNIPAGSLIFLPHSISGPLYISGPLSSPLHIPGRLSFMELSHWAPLSSGSSWFLPMGALIGDPRKGGERLGYLFPGYLAAEPQVGCDCLFIEGHSSCQALLYNCGCHVCKSLYSLSPFRPWCVSSTPPSIALSCFTIAGRLPLNPDSLVNSTFI